jgi:hypothetical protein
LRTTFIPPLLILSIPAFALAEIEEDIIFVVLIFVCVESGHNRKSLNQMRYWPSWISGSEYCFGIVWIEACMSLNTMNIDQRGISFLNQQHWGRGSTVEPYVERLGDMGVNPIDS